jgi:5-hydroxyisourate hydrolase
VSAVSTHVLDSTLGRPAVGVPVRLEQVGSSGADAPGTGTPAASVLAAAVTDEDGRVSELGPPDLAAGVYRLVFEVAAYFTAAGRDAFYPEVAVTFRASGTGGHYHVPLLLSPFAYTTYRGS